MRKCSTVLIWSTVPILQHPHCGCRCLPACRSFLFLSQLNPGCTPRLFLLKGCWFVPRYSDWLKKMQRRDFFKINPWHLKIKSSQLYHKISDIKLLTKIQAVRLALKWRVSLGAGFYCDKFPRTWRNLMWSGRRRTGSKKFPVQICQPEWSDVWYAMRGLAVLFFFPLDPIQCDPMLSGLKRVGVNHVITAPLSLGELPKQ